MSYCTAQDLIDRFGEQEIIQLTDRDNVGIIDATVLNQAISDATAEINGYLVNYLPMSSIPANLVRIACDIARYYLYDDQDVERVDTLYAQAMTYLKLVATGKMAIAPDVNGEIDVETVHSAVFNTSPSVFGRDSDY